MCLFFVFKEAGSSRARSWIEGRMDLKNRGKCGRAVQLVDGAGDWNKSSRRCCGHSRRCFYRGAVSTQSSTRHRVSSSHDGHPMGWSCFWLSVFLGSGSSMLAPFVSVGYPLFCSCVCFLQCRPRPPGLEWESAELKDAGLRSMSLMTVTDGGWMTLGKRSHDHSSPEQDRHSSLCTD